MEKSILRWVIFHPQSGIVAFGIALELGIEADDIKLAVYVLIVDCKQTLLSNLARSL